MGYAPPSASISATVNAKSLQTLASAMTMVTVAVIAIVVKVLATSSQEMFLIVVNMAEVQVSVFALATEAPHCIQAESGPSNGLTCLRAAWGQDWRPLDKLSRMCCVHSVQNLV